MDVCAFLNNKITYKVKQLSEHNIGSSVNKKEDSRRKSTHFYPTGEHPEKNSPSRHS
jgi:hypothetical protein